MRVDGHQLATGTTHQVAVNSSDGRTVEGNDRTREALDALRDGRLVHDLVDDICLILQMRDDLVDEVRADLLPNISGRIQELPEPIVVVGQEGGLRVRRVVGTELPAVWVFLGVLDLDGVEQADLHDDVAVVGLAHEREEFVEVRRVDLGQVVLEPAVDARSLEGRGTVGEVKLRPDTGEVVPIGLEGVQEPGIR